MSTDDVYGRKGEFCITIGLVTRSASILTQFVLKRCWLFIEPAVQLTWVVC